VHQKYADVIPLDEVLDYLARPRAMTADAAT
jgi:hypothetical protein